MVDQRGQFLLVSGLLVVLGFMIFATTVVTLNGMEERTHRVQGNTLVDRTDDIVHNLEESLAGMHRSGQLNRTDFQTAATITQTELEKNAIRSGLFATIRLAEETDLAFVQKAERCLGVDWSTSSAGGVIYGWDKETLKKSIVGAVYDIHVTDGEKTLRTQYYVRLQDCASDEIFTFANQWSAKLGLVKNLTASHLQPGTMNITEELDLENLVEVEVHPTINETSIEVHGWNKEDNLLNLDGTYTEMPSRQSSLPDNNWFRFQLDPPVRMQVDDSIPNVTLEVTGYRSNDPTSQSMFLRVYGNGSWENPVIDEEIELSEGPPSQAAIIVLEELHAGQDNWTYDDIADTHWELTVSGDHEASQQWNVDHFNMTGSVLMAQAHRMNVTFEWPEIPGVYRDHEVDLHYRIVPSTPDEGFRLEVRDLDGALDGGEWALVHNMTDTVGLPDDLRKVQGVKLFDGQDPPDPDAPVRFEFRVVDTDHQDNWIPQDQDTVQIQFLQVKSRLSG